LYFYTLPLFTSKTISQRRHHAHRSNHHSATQNNRRRVSNVIEQSPTQLPATPLRHQNDPRAANQIALLLKLFRLLADILFVRFVPLRLLSNIFREASPSFPCPPAPMRKQIRNALHLMKPNILRLIIRPLIGGPRFAAATPPYARDAQQSRPCHQTAKIEMVSEPARVR